MGTLRLKRGTKTALQTTPGFTPAEGELVYTTDSKEVFVGDGITQGGVPVSVSTQNLEDLGNVQALAAQKDQILVYNGSNWAATDNPQIDLRGNIYADDSTLLVDAINGKIVAPVETSSVTATNIVGNLVGDVTGSVTGNVVGNTTGTHFGNVTGNLLGDMLGSVFSDDSSVMIDSVGKRVVANIESPSITTTKEITITTGGDNSAILATGIAGAGSTGPKLIVRSSNGTTVAPTVVVGGTTAPTTTFVNSTTVRFTTPAKTAGDYDVTFTNANGLAATLTSGISYNGVPAFSTAAGNVGSVVEDEAISTTKYTR